MTDPAPAWDAIDRRAQAFFDAFLAGDVETLRASLAPGFTAWHNSDDVAQTVEEHLATLAWLKRSIDGLRYEDVRRRPCGDGFVQEHVMRGTVRGEPLALIACVIGRFDETGERLIETREYLDSKQLRLLYAKKA